MFALPPFKKGGLGGICVAVFVLSLLSPSLSFAKDTGLQGFNVQQFRPNIDGYGFYNVNVSKVLPHLKFSLGFFSNFSSDVVSAVMPARADTLKIVDKNFTTDLNAAFGLWNFAEVGLNVPVSLYQNGYNYNDLQKYSTARAGDARLGIKFKIINGIALLSETTLPIGSQSAFTGYNGSTWEGKLILDKTFKSISFAANVGYRFIKRTDVLSTAYDDVLTFGGGARYTLPFNDRSWAILAEVSGETVAGDLKEVSTPVEIKGGIRKKLSSGFALDLGGGRGIMSAYGSPAFRVIAGLTYNLDVHQKQRTEAVQSAVPIEPSDYLTIEPIHTVYFMFNESEMMPKKQVELKELVRKLQKNMPKKILVEGHADLWGEEAYNGNLSEDRAMDVKKYMIKFGIPEEIIEIRWHGSSKPIYTEMTFEGQKKNRRVEVKIVQ